MIIKKALCVGLLVVGVMELYGAEAAEWGDGEERTLTFQEIEQLMIPIKDEVAKLQDSVFEQQRAAMAGWLRSFSCAPNSDLRLPGEGRSGLNCQAQMDGAQRIMEDAAFASFRKNWSEKLVYDEFNRNYSAKRVGDQMCLVKKLENKQ
jgi:hypothetical protein